MKPINVFRLELCSAFSSVRTLVFRLGVAFLLGAPFVFIAMPVRIRVVGLVMLTLFTSFFGTAVSLVRARSEGRLTRLRVLPIPGWRMASDQLFAWSLVDFAQTGPLMFLLVAVSGHPISPGLGLRLAGLYCITVLLLNVAGFTLGWVMKNNPEVHLCGGLIVMGVGLLSGLVPVPSRIEPLVEVTAIFSPVGRLADALERAVTGVPQHEGALAGALFFLIFSGTLIGRAVDWRTRFGRR
ncbi:MAG: ABC transporter permease [Deltaproteobacteria bacterium]|nr:ABC transporter permease [Deltaproteobacteria bacterium]